MPADPMLQPGPADMELTLLRKINKIASSLVAPDANLTSGEHDVEYMSLRKINQLLWNLLDAGEATVSDPVGPWVAPIFELNYSGTLMARWFGDPTVGMVELKGQLTGDPWGSSAQLIGTLPPGLQPAANRYVAVPSADAGSANGFSALVVTPVGQMLLYAIVGTAPAQAWFDGVTFALN